RQQFFGYVVFLGAHCAYGQSGLRRRLIVRLHKILHTLNLEVMAATSWSELSTIQFQSGGIRKLQHLNVIARQQPLHLRTSCSIAHSTAC
ncbi:hypothetical protein, partial [Comamonas thiooxydans]